MIDITAQDVAFHWPLAMPLRLVPIAKGTNNQSYLVELDAGSYILKVHSNRPVAERLAFEQELLVFFSMSHLPFAVPVSIQTRLGEASVQINDVRASLSRLIPGQTPTCGSVSEAYRCGEALATLDIALQAMMFSPAIRVPETFGDLSSVHPLISDPIKSMYQVIGRDALTDGLAVAMMALQEQWRRQTSGWTTQIIHSDFYPTNVLMDSGGITGILDFEFAGSGYRAMDFAIGLFAFGVGNWEHDQPWLVLESFANGYLGRVPLTDDEIAATPMFIRMRELTSFVHWLGRIELGLTVATEGRTRACKVLAVERWLHQNERQLIYRLFRITSER